MIIADSDVLIDFLRGRGEGARRVAMELETRSFGTTTAITAFEIRSGARTVCQKKSVDTLLEARTRGRALTGAPRRLAVGPPRRAVKG